MTQLVFHRRQDKHAGAGGFSLVELLVVIAMTCVLAALILPALSGAKEKSYRAVCKGNERQLYVVFRSYADDNLDVLPSAADNIGNYHSIRLSDATFNDLVDNYAAGCTNIFYCPNLMFNAGANGLPTHDNYGTIIGYSYLVSNVVYTSTKGADPVPNQIRLSSLAATNEILADANYWGLTTTASSINSMAPHTSAGARLAGQAGGASTVVKSSATLGAVGGNVTRADGSVYWRSISSMQTNSASSTSDAYGAW